MNVAKPDYEKGSIVNLMSSIAAALGGKSSYRHLGILDPGELSKSKNIVLFVIDGMGYSYLARNGRGSILRKHLRGKITSVFPTNTAVCGTTFLTGAAPQQHAVSGWFVLDSKIADLSDAIKTNSKNARPISDGLSAQSYLLFQKETAEKAYVKLAVGTGRLMSYGTLDELCSAIKRIIRSGDDRKFIFAHWPGFDDLSHIHGPRSRSLKSHFKELNQKLSAFLKSIENSNTTLIFTADHGQVETNAKRIEPGNHPALMETLVVPPFGDPRVAFFRVRPAKKKDFESYVNRNLGKYCTMHKSRDLVDQGYFGKFTPSSILHQRIGDYALITKGKYTIWAETNKTGKPNKGEHGGISDEEMFVPLCVIKR
jgi:hypothetical protein